MTAIAGPLHLVALVLVVSGLTKVVAPRPAAEAMRSAGLPLPVGLTAPAGMVLGLIEAGVGLVAVAVPSRLATGVLALAYLALAGFVVALRRRDATASCGCFGSASTPPTTAHVVANLVGAAVAAVATAAGPPDVIDVVVDDGLAVAVPYLALVVTGASLVLAAPGLLAGLRDVAGSPRAFGSVR